MQRRPFVAGRRVRHAVTEWVQSLAGALGIYATPRSDPRDVSAFLGSLAPVTSGFDMITLGDLGRGGYVVPDDFDGVVSLVSPGVGTDVTFDAALLARGVPCYLLDGTISRSPLEETGVTMDFRCLAASAIHDHDSVRLEDLLLEGRIPTEGDLILQMDVEGAEWGCLRGLPRHTLRRFRIVVVEFHDVTRAMSAHLLPVMQEAIDVLTRDFVVVAARVNPVGGSRRVGATYVPRLLEVTFHRRDRHEAGIADASAQRASADAHASTSRA